VERGNPVGVRLFGSGKPTARNAQLPSGNRMTKKRAPVAERQQETEASWLAPPPVVSHNWPDTGLVPGPERVLTWSGEPQDDVGERQNPRASWTPLRR
jgi:hypothetical protein